MKEKKYRILSIDGGGIRGIIPAKILSELEQELSLTSDKKLYEHFDLVCGTSTGAILAIGIALGIPAKKILTFYKEYAKFIFPPRLFKVLPRKACAIVTSFYTNKILKQKLKEIFTEANSNQTPLLMDLKTSICIPTYNGGTGEINVLKTKHHQEYNRDYKLPAHDVALSSASAPIYFPPHSFQYEHEFGSGININMIDGGIFANHPALIGLLEATEKLKIPIAEVEIISLGTGRGKHIIKKSWQPKNLWYWLIPNPRLLDIIIDSQSQITEQYLQFIQRVFKDRGNTFEYLRVQHEFGAQPIELNSSKKADIEKLEAIGGELSKKQLNNILKLINHGGL